MRQIVVIGAGPAGCLAALLLARAGKSVTIVEKHRPGRDKVCGECLSSLGMQVLQELGLGEDMKRLGAIQLNRVAIYGHQSISLPLSRPMWGISRSALDPFLLNQAVAAGAAILQPARCERIETGLQLIVHVRDLRSNRVQMLTPRHVILADGKAALAYANHRWTSHFGIKAHFEQIDGPIDAIELFGCNGCYGGLAPIEGGRWNAAFSIPAARIRAHRGNLQSLFQQIINENRILKARIAPARRASRWLATALPSYGVPRCAANGVIPVGNAAAAIEPIGGDGMGLALRSAQIAATALIENDAASLDSLRSEYRRLWRLRPLLLRAAAAIISSPSFSRSLLPLLGVNSIARPTMRLLGK